MLKLEFDNVEPTRVTSLLQAKAEHREPELVKKEAPEVIDLSTESPLLRPSSILPNTVLPETRRYREDSESERQRREEDLEAKCAEYEHQLAHSKSMVAKALGEKFAAQEAFNKIRAESEALKKQLQLQNSESLSHRGPQLEVEDLKNELSRVTAQLRAAEVQNAQLMQTLHEVVEMRESLKQEVKDNAHMVKMFKNMSELHDKTEAARVELQRKCASLERLLVEKDGEAAAEALAKCKEFILQLPGPEHPRPFSEENLEPVCNFTPNLHAQLAKDPTANRFLNHLLFLPGRLMPVSDVNYLAWGPTHLYDRASDAWVEGSDLVGCQGGTRELFFKKHTSIMYAGTYKCHDLRALHVEGINVLFPIVQKDVLDVALGVPHPPYTKQTIERCWPDGKVKVIATGLEYVGFNMPLYNSLRERFVHEQKGKAKKRTAAEAATGQEEEGGGGGSSKKRKKNKKNASQEGL